MNHDINATHWYKNNNTRFAKWMNNSLKRKCTAKYAVQADIKFNYFIFNARFELLRYVDRNSILQLYSWHLVCDFLSITKRCKSNMLFSSRTSYQKLSNININVRTHQNLELLPLGEPLSHAPCLLNHCIKIELIQHVCICITWLINLDIACATTKQEYSPHHDYDISDISNYHKLAPNRRLHKVQDTIPIRKILLIRIWQNRRWFLSEDVYTCGTPRFPVQISNCQKRYYVTTQNITCILSVWLAIDACCQALCMFFLIMIFFFIL